jgi:hypothetical protein
MLDWMSAINAHIHMRYVAEWHITTDFWDRGNVETSFWKVRFVHGTSPLTEVHNSLCR